MNQNPLKFRIWDKVHNKFLPKSQETEFGFVDYFLDQDGKVTAFQEESSAEARIENISLSAINESTGELIPASDRFVVQRFTGLTDKKNKELFEGDIIKFRSYEDWGDKEGYILNLPIVWRETPQGEHIFAGWSVGRCGSIPNDFEIIGNIFENSNLIK